MTEAPPPRSSLMIDGADYIEMAREAMYDATTDETIGVKYGQADRLLLDREGYERRLAEGMRRLQKED